MQLSHCLRYGDVGSLSTIHPTHMDVPALFRIYLISGIVIFPVKPIMFSCQSRLSFNFSQYPAVCLPFFALPPVCNAPVSTPDLYGYARRTQRGQRAESRTIWPITIKNKHPLWIFQILTVVKWPKTPGYQRVQGGSVTGHTRKFYRLRKSEIPMTRSQRQYFFG